MKVDIAQLRGGYGSMGILHGVDLALEVGELVVIVGPNGAGKSTLIKAICGLLDIRAGRIAFDGTDITAAPPERLVSLGIGYVPQEPPASASGGAVDHRIQDDGDAGMW